MNAPKSSRRAWGLGPRLAIVALVGLALWAMVVSCGASEGKLSVRSVRIDEPVNGRSAVVRMVIENDTATDDELLSVTTREASSATVHRSEMDAQDRSTMADMDSVRVPAGTSTVFQAGGLHVMLQQFTKPFAVGTKVHLTLTFANAGVRTVTGVVVPLG